MSVHGGGSTPAGGYRYADEHTPPPARPAGEGAVERFEHVFEVDPELMTVHVAQQLFPNWDTLRIVAARAGHLAWMHRHWADTVVSGQEILDGLGGPERASAPVSRTPPGRSARPSG